MTYSSRTDAPDISWADTGDDDGQTQRHGGMDREQHDPATVLAGLPPRGGTAATPTSAADFDSLGERPDFHEASPPAPVATAWAAVEAAVEAATEAERDERSLDGQEAQAQRVEAARVRSATASGKVVNASAGRDWAAERRHLAAVAAGHRERARRLRGEYDALVLEHQQDWCERIVESMPSAKAATLDALTDVKDRVERLLGAASAAQAMQREEGGSVVSLPTVQVRTFCEVAQALADQIEASPQLGGVDLVHPRMEPSWRDREQMAVGIRHGVIDGSTHWLAALERSENYTRSSFTAGLPLGEKPSGESTW